MAGAKDVLRQVKHGGFLVRSSSAASLDVDV